MRGEKVTRIPNHSGGGLAIGVSAILAAAFSMLCLMALAAAYSATELSDDTATLAVRIITYASILFAGIIAGRAANKRGWLRGMLAGASYYFSVRLIGAVWMKSVGADLWIALLLGALLGAVGGIIGINLPRRKKR